MPLTFRSGLFRTWLVVSIVWMALTALAGAPYYIVFVVPLSGRLVMEIIQEKRDFDAIRQRRHEIIDEQPAKQKRSTERHYAQS